MKYQITQTWTGLPLEQPISIWTDVAATFQTKINLTHSLLGLPRHAHYFQQSALVLRAMKAPHPEYISPLITLISATINPIGKCSVCPDGLNPLCGPAMSKLDADGLKLLLQKMSGSKTLELLQDPSKDEELMKLREKEMKEHEKKLLAEKKSQKKDCSAIKKMNLSLVQKQINVWNLGAAALLGSGKVTPCPPTWGQTMGAVALLGFRGGSHYHPAFPLGAKILDRESEEAKNAKQRQDAHKQREKSATSKVLHIACTRGGKMRVRIGFAQRKSSIADLARTPLVSGTSVSTPTKKAPESQPLPLQGGSPSELVTPAKTAAPLEQKGEAEDVLVAMSKEGHDLKDTLSKMAAMANQDFLTHLTGFLIYLRKIAHYGTSEAPESEVLGPADAETEAEIEGIGFVALEGAMEDGIKLTMGKQMKMIQDFSVVRRVCKLDFYKRKTDNDNDPSSKRRQIAFRPTDPDRSRNPRIPLGAWDSFRQGHQKLEGIRASEI